MNQGFCGPTKPDRNAAATARCACGRPGQRSDNAAGAVGWRLGQQRPFVFTDGPRLEPKKGSSRRRCESAGIPRCHAFDVRSRQRPARLSRTSLSALVCRSIDGSTGGDLLAAKPGVHRHGYVIGDGVNHGSPLRPSGAAHRSSARKTSATSTIAPR
jgi:hypothetical protein